MTAECKISFGDDENVLQLGGGDGYTILNALKITELCPLRYVNYILIKLVKNQCS